MKQSTIERARYAIDRCIICGVPVDIWGGTLPLDEDEVAKVRAMRANADLQGKAALSELIAVNDEVLAEIGRGEWVTR